MCGVQTIAVAALAFCDVLAADSRTQVSPADPSGYVVIVPAGRTTIALEEIVRAAAPVLWFSDDEPARRDGAYPASILDETSGPRVVYYKARLRTTVQLPNCVNPTPFSHSPTCDSKDLGTDTAFSLSQVRSIHLRFYVYYRRDYGFGGHPHDLEEIDVYLAKQGGALVLARLTGAAHGQGWYSNELRLDKDDDMQIPIRVLVEEGKHAMAPDRNADGVYTPRYDVTHYPNDAWGIRDSMNGKYLAGNRFESYMFKPRKPANAVWPPADRPAASVSDQPPRYDLRHSVEESVCNPATSQPLSSAALKVPDPGMLRSLLKLKEFCGGRMRTLVGGLYPFSNLRPFMRNPFELMSFGLRREGEDVGGRATYAIPGVTAFRAPGLDGWLVVQGTFVWPRPDEPQTETISSPNQGVFVERRIRSSPRIELMYSPSASRVFDWFVTLGVDFVPQETLRDEAGDKLRLHMRRQIVRFLEERASLQVGSVLHIPIPDTWLRGQLPPMLYVRTGLITDRFKALEDPRIVFELGVGVF